MWTTSFPRATGPALIAGLALSGVAAHGQVLAEDETLLAPGGANDDRFGAAVAAAADFVVVGAPGAEIDGENQSGAAYVFPRPTVDAPDPTPISLTPFRALGSNHVFGSAVAANDFLIAVGRPGYVDSFSGSALGAVDLFLPGGDAVSNLTPIDGERNARFGNAVAISDQRIAVGAFRRGGQAFQAGAVYMYNISGPPLSLSSAGVCFAPDAETADQLGTSVGVSGTIVIAGAPLDDTGDLVSSGSARLFETAGSGNPPQIAVLTAPDAESGDRFGAAVAIDNGLAIVGAPGANPPGDDTTFKDVGAVYVFDVSDPGTPVFRSVIRPTTAGSPGEFGFSVALDGTTAVIGAPTADIDAGPQAGQAAAYDLTDPAQPVLLGHLVSTETTTTNNAGFAVALAEQTVVVGSPEDNNTNGFEAGSVDVFTLPLCAADFDASGAVNVLDVVAMITAWQDGLDYNGDASVNILDVVGFIQIWSGGCP